MRKWVKWTWLAASLALAAGTWFALASYRLDQAVKSSMRISDRLNRQCREAHGTAPSAREPSCEMHWRAHELAEDGRQRDAYLFGLWGPLGVVILSGGAYLIVRRRRTADS